MIELYKDVKNFYVSFLQGVSDVADDKNPGKSWFPEMYMDFMSPCEYVLKWKFLSDKQRQNLQKLYDMLENYDDSYDNRKKTDKEICHDPKWRKIREFAKIVYDDLKNVKYIP